MKTSLSTERAPESDRSRQLQYSALAENCLLLAERINQSKFYIFLNGYVTLSLIKATNFPLFQRSDVIILERCWEN